MKMIKTLITVMLILIYFTSCFSKGIKMNNVFTDKNEFEHYILDNLNKQYGIEFELTAYLGGHGPRYSLSEDYSGFTGNVKPKQSDSRLPHGYYTVCNSSGTFKTQAHVYMFEKQLRSDVEKILCENNIEYDIIEFRGMDRNINKWSKDSSYGEYKVSKDYETWIYIKLPPQKRHDCDYDYNRKYYAPIILPQVKKIYSILEPEYNVTLIFYLDEYNDKFYSEYEKKLYVHDQKNATVVWLDLSKFNNYLDWTEYDIEAEVGALSEATFITAWKKANGIE